MPRRPIDRQGQPDRARTNDDDLCILHRIFPPPLLVLVAAREGATLAAHRAPGR